MGTSPTKPRAKIARTIELVRAYEAASGHSMSGSQAFRLWWFSQAGDSCLRLTSTGFKVLHTVLAYPAYQVPFVLLSHLMLVQLSKAMTEPYYVDGPERVVWIFSETAAVTAMLYGNIHEYLQSVCSTT